VDLTHPFEPGIPHWIGFPDEVVTPLWERADVAGFMSHEYRHVGQWGTHVDAPFHFVRDGAAVDEIPVREMVLPLVVVDVRAEGAADPDFVCTRATIEAWEAAYGRVPAGAFVALHTGWDARWPDGDAMQNVGADGLPHYPGWGVDAVAMLVEERGALAIGHDQPDTDPGTHVHTLDLAAEAYILKAGRWQIEMLTNLGQVPATGALIVATWPRPRGGTGFPARCFAIVED
jgi:kynurenine formamidase